MKQLRSLAPRALRASALVVLISAFAATGAIASLNTQPVISQVNPSWLVTSGELITISGDHFSSDTSPNDCSVIGAPTLTFTPFDGSSPVPTNQFSQCSNTLLQVNVPSNALGGGGAAIQVVDNTPQHNASASREITVQPTASMSPTSGQVGTVVQVTGGNLRPADLAPNALLQYTFAGATQQLSSWSGSGFSFSPGNQSGSLTFNFPVCTDPGSACSPVQAAVAPSPGTFTFLPPSLSTGRITTTAGSQIALTGSNLGSSGTVSFPGGLTCPSSACGRPAWSGSQRIQVTVPFGAQPGAIGVSVDGYGPVTQASGACAAPAPCLSLNPLLRGATPGSGPAGTQVTLGGFNFGASSGSVSLGGVNQLTARWNDQSITFTISADTDGGAVLVTRNDGVTSNPANITVSPLAQRIEQAQVPVGATIIVDGVSFGSATGTLRVGGQQLPAQLWSRTAVVAVLPQKIAPGTYPLVVVNAAGNASNTLQLTVTPPPPTPTPSSRPRSGSSGGSGSVAPSFDNNHQFVKPPKAPSPVELSVDVEPKRVPVGGTATVTVTLKLLGRAVPGADIRLLMIYSPASDTSFSPATGTTDASGTFKATVTISKTPGSNVILAQSGAFSDQDQVLGLGQQHKSSATTSPSQPNPASFGGFVPLLALGVVAALLVGGGFFINLRARA